MHWQRSSGWEEVTLSTVKSLVCETLHILPLVIFTTIP